MTKHLLMVNNLLVLLRPISTQENKHGIGIGPDRYKIEPAHGLWVLIFCSSLNLLSATRMINPDDIWCGDVDNTRWKKVESDPMLIFLSGHRPS